MCSLAVDWLTMVSVDMQAVAVVFEGTAGVSGEGEGDEDEPSRLRLAKDAVAGLPTVITRWWRIKQKLV